MQNNPGEYLPRSFCNSNPAMCPCCVSWRQMMKRLKSAALFRDIISSNLLFFLTPSSTDSIDFLWMFEIQFLAYNLATSPPSSVMISVNVVQWSLILFNTVSSRGRHEPFASFQTSGLRRKKTNELKMTKKLQQLLRTHSLQQTTHEFPSPGNKVLLYLLSTGCDFCRTMAQDSSSTFISWETRK